MIKAAKWIWLAEGERKDQYADFISEFDYSDRAEMTISCDSNYIVYINGVMAAFGQYPDYPDYKVCDVIDVSPFLHPGKNSLLVKVWYYGENFYTYKLGRAGVLFEIKSGDRVLCASGADTLSRQSADYVSGLCKLMTYQIGWSYRYDCGATGDTDFARSREVTGISYELHERPVSRLQLGERISAVCIDEKKQLYDLGEETAGFLDISFTARKGALITVAFGEHITDGDVRYAIGPRLFTVELIAGEGESRALCAFRRLGLRYMRVTSEDEFEVRHIAIRPVRYPVSRIPYSAGSALRQKIYDVGVKTLELCMHEHYEDCPWREQALYTMDSRNQMLCGYAAFGETAFPRACLELMSHGQKEDGLLTICFPSGLDAPIPYYSLIYINQVCEYVRQSGDAEFFVLKAPVMRKILDVFLKRIEQTIGLAANFAGHWNFYEWTEGMDGIEGDELIPSVYKKSYDLPLNCFIILALRDFCDFCGDEEKRNYEDILLRLKRSVRSAFYDESKKMFFTYLGKAPHYSRLANSLAILAGCADDCAGSVACSIMNSSGMTDTSLAMKMYEYDALLAAGDNGEYILKDIEKVFGGMLDRGATSFWETADGEKAFGGAGSLCHGWSALPVLYLPKLEKHD